MPLCCPIGLCLNLCRKAYSTEPPTELPTKPPSEPPTEPSTKPPTPPSNTSPTASMPRPVSDAGIPSTSYLGQQQLKKDVKAKCISCSEKNKKFLPANMLEKLVTRDVVLSAFKETGKIADSELDHLTQNVLQGRRRLFLILVSMADVGKEKLSSLGNQMWDHIRDDSLPFTVIDKSPDIQIFTYTNPKSGKTQEFEPTARDDKELIEFFDKEAKNLARLQRIESQHLIKPIAAYKKDSERSLLFPWAHGGNLATYWEKHDNNRGDRKNLRWIMKQLVGICSALVVLHQDANNGHGRHGDLKPENILWFLGHDEGCLKIADMGLSTFHEEEANTRQRNKDNIITITPSGTFRYEPPEMDKDRHNGRPRSRQYDIWSMGCIMIDLLVWLLYGYDAVKRFRKTAVQFWERTSATDYYIAPYISACMDSMEKHLGEGTAYTSLLRLVRRRVLIVDVSDEYKSSPSHREIASELHRQMLEIQQGLDESYTIPTDLDYPDEDIEKARQRYIRPHSEGGRLAVGAPTASTRTSMPDSFGEPTKLNDVWESIPDNKFARRLFNSLSWDTVKPLADQETVSLCGSCSTAKLGDLLKPNINRNELDTSSQSCDLCGLLRDALNAQESDLPEVISLRQNESVVRIENGPNLLSIYVDPDSDLVEGLQLGLPKLPDHGSREQFLLLKEWIQECDANHETCRRFDTEEGDDKLEFTMPTRLVKLGNPLQLVESVSIEASPYVALSHCWGKTESLCTTNGNIAQLRKSIEFSDLPKNFRDAVQVTRGIGIEYLWIDSLCIIQDDKDDWEHESTQMEQVFSFAYCTIGASSSKSSAEGFFYDRCRRRCVQLETTNTGKLYVCRNIDDFHRDVELGELNSRGWVLQERALSRRSIFYTTTQVYWECGAGVHCETLTRLKNAKAALLGDARFPSSALEYYRDGRQMLVQNLYERYSGLAFTHNWDRPVAILGLQERLARAFKTRGAHGLFSTYFRRLLLWKRSGTHHMIRIKEHAGARHHIPTWSWFSKVGAIEYLELKFQEIDWATSDIENPFDLPFSGATDACGGAFIAMTLRGQARKLELSRSELTRYAILDESEDENVDVNDLRCVVIGKDKFRGSSDGEKYHTLIIRRVPNAPEVDRYERVGVASLKPNHMAKGGFWVTIQ
ncbi:hypothetical protein F4777DRAFT_588102 [Nemania sp. FL0916]|nr:hypothetical protein F4777DRAFT_588102 [Nemania sp. FL0916]